MAYKFQLGSAILSGSTKFEELVEAAGGFKPTVADTAAAVADDSFYFQDADGEMKRESMADYATTIAGDGLAASSGVLSVGVDDTGIELNSDALRLKDNGVTLAKMAGIARGSIISGDASGDPQALSVGSAHQFLQSDGSDLAYVSMSGDATLAAGVLSIGATKVTDAMMNDDVATGLAGAGIAAASGVLALDIDELSALGGTGVDQADHFVFSDGGTEKKITFSNMEDAIFGNVSGDIAVAAGGAATIQANAVEDSMVNDNVATGLAGVGLSAASGVLAVDASELSDAAVASGDKFVFQDATDDSTKKESIDDIATFMAGSGLKADAGVLEVRVSGSIVRDSDKIGISGSIAGDGLKFLGGANAISTLEVDLNEMGAGAVAVGADHFVFVDADDNITKKESFADFATAIAGNGLAASSGVLAVGVDDSGIELNSDALRLKDNGVTLAKMAGIARGSIISGDASGDPQALAAGSAHQFLQSDGTDLAYVSMSGDATLAAGVLSIGATKVTDAMMNDDVATGLAGDGLAAASGVLSVGVDDSTIETNSDALRIKDNGVTGAKLNTDVISAQAELAHADIADADELMISDGGLLKKVGLDSLRDHFFGVVSGDATVADGGALTIASDAVEDSMVNDNVATGLAGTGLSAASGVLHARLDVAAKADGGTLAAGVNYFADLSSDATVTLPASPEIGDTVVAKAKGLSSAVIIINKAGSQTIDGETSVTIESPYGAVSMVYVASNDWRLV